MSRLYGKISSDRRKTDATAGANEQIRSRFTWGSAQSPNIATIVDIEYPKGSDYPKVYLTLGYDIEIEVYKGNEIVYQCKPE